MRTVSNKMSIKFESRSVNEAFARQAVGAFASQLDPTMEELGDKRPLSPKRSPTRSRTWLCRQERLITVAVRLFEGRA